MTNTKKRIVAVAAGVAALGGGLGIAQLASADPTPTPSTPSSTPSTGPGAPGDFRGHRGGDRNGELASQLATKLGVDQAKVTAALQKFREANKPTGTPTPGQTRPDPAARDAELAKALATELKIDEAKVKAALDEIRAARSTAEAAALKSKLDAAVKAGTLTQAEADAVTKAVGKGVIHAGGR